MGDSIEPNIGEKAERVLVFVLLCACVIYISKVVFNFRDLGLTLRRNDDPADVLSDTEEERDHDA